MQEKLRESYCITAVPIVYFEHILSLNRLTVNDELLLN